MQTYTVILCLVTDPSIRRRILVKAENAVKACKVAQTQEGSHWLAYEAEIAN